MQLRLKTSQADELDELPEFDSQPENISFDGYTGEGGVNEEIAVQHTPEIVPETATRVAMYTPVSADLERGVGSGTRPDGTPIRMPKAMEGGTPQDKPYFYPPIDLLQFSQQGGVSLKEQRRLDAEKAQKLEDTLQSFGIQAKVVGVSRGPAITRFEMTPAPGVRVSKISGLADDIALNLAASGVRIESAHPRQARRGHRGAQRGHRHRSLCGRCMTTRGAFVEAKSKLARWRWDEDIAGKRSCWRIWQRCPMCSSPAPPVRVSRCASTRSSCRILYTRHRPRRSSC